MLKRKKIFILSLMVILMSSIILCAGHFLLNRTSPQAVSKITPTHTTDVSAKKMEKNEEQPVLYKHVSMEYKGNRQEINILEIDVSNPGVRVKPVLSYDNVFGFEKLSLMAERNDAFAAVNAGFFHAYGQPGGMVVIDGKLISNSTGEYPVLTIDQGKALLKRVNMKLYLQYGDNKITVNDVNVSSKRGKAILYTPFYGTTNRAESGNISVVIENNVVKRIEKRTKETDIPEQGMVLTWYPPYPYQPDHFPLKVGDVVKFGYDLGLSVDAQAYECGGWIVKNRKIVMGQWNPWVGVMTNQDPRTMVGIKNDGKVVFITVDGRQPGYSTGFTGREMGEFLLDYGIENAAMLDGGASTEMIVKSKMVNKPSFKGEERPLAGGFVIQYLPSR